MHTASWDFRCFLARASTVKTPLWKAGRWLTELVFWSAVHIECGTTTVLEDEMSTSGSEPTFTSKMYEILPNARRPMRERVSAVERALP